MLTLMAYYFSVPIVIFRNQLNADESAFLGIQASLLFLSISALIFFAKWVINKI